MARTVSFGLLTALWAVSPALAQEPAARISGPVLGYVLDTDAVRPLFGMPGAAMLGPRLALAGEISEGALAHEAGYALAVAGPEREVWLFRNLAGEVSALPLPEAPPAPERLLLSPSGRAAALGYGSESVIVTGLPDAPTLRRAALPPASRLWAVSDDGALLLLSAPRGEGDAVYLLGPEGDLRFLISLGKTGAAAFFTGRAEAVLADGLHNAVYRVSASGEVIPLAGPAGGISGPVAVSLSRDNLRAFVASADTATVTVLDLAGGPASLVSCPCKLTALERLEGNAVFRVSDPSAEPLWVFDGDSAQPRVVFIPSAPPAVPASGGVQ